ncbi:serine/threonine protein kinase, partial [Streptomyces sp. SID14478]|nr:serine/threonine protein kinase [Streptomyces sp. SID14478]
RRRWPRVLAVVVAALLVGGGGAAGAMYYADHRDDGSGASAQDAGGQDGSGDANGKQDGQDGQDKGGSQGSKSGAIPDDWVRVNDVEGFSLMLPPGWQNRQANGNQIDYTPDGGQRFVRIAIDKNSQWRDSYQHQLDLEKNLSRKLPGYKRVALDSNMFRDRHGSLWEFTWTAGSKDATSGPRHAIEETYRTEDGTEYAIYLSVPAEKWTGAREQFDAILRGWQPPA